MKLRRIHLIVDIESPRGKVAAQACMPRLHINFESKFYTRDEARVTCFECKAKLPVSPPINARLACEPNRSDGGCPSPPGHARRRVDRTTAHAGSDAICPSGDGDCRT